MPPARRVPGGVVEQVVDRAAEALGDRRRAAPARSSPRTAARERCAVPAPATPPRPSPAARRRSRAPGSSPRASSIRSLTSDASSSDCSTTSVSIAWRSFGSSSSVCSRISMLVRRLVTGVRSSCEASATSWRWARTESSSALRDPCRRSSIWLNRLASRPTSSSAWTWIRSDRSSVSAMCCAVRSTSLSGLSTRRLANRPSVPATSTPPISTNSRIRRRLERIGVDAVERAGELQRDRVGRCRSGRPGTVRTRRSA